MPRSSHGTWELPTGRRGPVEILSEQAEVRDKDLVPIRHGRMGVSPFTFYRGAAAVMAADLARTPVSGVRAQLCGDAHLLNFGGYASPERDLVFDVNDFDETLTGPWEWDLKRLAASIVVAGRSGGLPPSACRDAAEATARQYRQSMHHMAAMTELEVWYAKMNLALLTDQLRIEGGLKSTPNLQRTVAKARSKDQLKAFSKLTRVVDGEARILSDPPTLVPLGDFVDSATRPLVEKELLGIFRAYRRSLQRDRRHLLERYRLVDVARKVVGVGSVGTRCWVALLMGKDNSDPLFMQVKQAQESVLAPFAGKSSFTNEGERVVEGQRLMQSASDIFLGWVRVTGIDEVRRDYYIRQLWDWKGSADPASLTETNLPYYGRMCAWTLARAHARSGDRVAIAAYLGSRETFDSAIGRFADAYADQNERDYAEFTEAVKTGKLPSEEGI